MTTFKVPHQDMPDILIGSLVTAESDTGTQKALAAPHVTGNHFQLSNPQGFRAIDLQFDWFLHIGFEQVFECVILLVLGESRVFYEEHLNHLHAHNNCICVNHD